MVLGRGSLLTEQHGTRFDGRCASLGRVGDPAGFNGDVAVSEPAHVSRAQRESLGYLPWLVDVLAAVVVVGVFWLPALTGATPAWRSAAGLALAAVAAVSMVVRWRLPGVSTVAAAVATIVGGLLGVCEDPMLAAAWCLYPLAVTRAARTRVFALIAVCLVTVFAAVTAIPEQSGVGQRVVIAAAALGVSWLFGTTAGRRIEAAREAERAHAAEQATRVQLDVARDVHDVVGHALGVVSAEAGVTRRLVDASEQELRDSLADIEQHARTALEDVQALVRSLRTAQLDEGDAATPLPTLSRLPSLITTTRATGLRVDARVEAADEQVDEVVSSVAFRIVQEALSNVVRHAPGASCHVDVHRDGDELVVRVRDDGPGGEQANTSGFGLRGVRERARLVGGTARWQDVPEGGFEVEARLPLGKPG